MTWFSNPFPPPLGFKLVVSGVAEVGFIMEINTLEHLGKLLLHSLPGLFSHRDQLIRHLNIALLLQLAMGLDDVMCRFSDKIPACR